MKTFARCICLMLVLTFILSGCVSPESATTNPQTSVSVSTQPTVTDPTEPTVPVTRPTEPTQPATQPTEPTEPPTQPTEPTQPVTEPTEPTEPEDVLVESITLTAPKNTISVMEQLQITATILPENAAVLTVMYNTTGGQVLDNGVFFATEPGVYEITAYAMDDSGVYGTITIIVEAAPVTGIAISGGNTVTVGKTFQLSAVVSPEFATDPSITWTIVSGSEFATIDQNGLLTAVAPGTVTIQAAANDGSGVTATHTVEITPVSITSISISGGKKVTVGDTLQLKAEVKPADAADCSVIWSITSGSEFATIDQNGLLTAIAPGKVTVQVTANDGSGVTATHKVEIQPILVNKITISGENTVKVGKTIQLTASVQPDNAADKSVKWSISKGSKYATITDDGVLTGVAAGSVTVKVTAQDGSGISATFKITVEEAAMWDGSGTKDDPFLIRCLEDLLNLQNVTKKSGYYYRQVADIDCSSVGNWIVIGDEDNPFRHHYDGGNFTISNLCLDGEATGLISVAKDATFRNIDLRNVTAQAVGDVNTKYKQNLGALAGYAIGCSFYDCNAAVDFRCGGPGTGGLVGRVILVAGQADLMKKCHTVGYLEGQGEGLGGLIGYIEKDFWNYESSDSSALVQNCSAAVEIQAGTGGNTVGGLIGEANNVRVLHCHATGDVTASKEGIGGLIGQAYYDAEIAYCYATGNVVCTSASQYGGSFAGGLVGFMLSYAKMHDCYATGDVTAEKLGWSDCQDQSSYDGGPWLRYRNPCGSLVGCVQMMGSYGKTVLYNCYATGFVTAPLICEDERVYCHGALVGCFYDNYTRKYIIDTKKTDQTDWAGFNDTSIENLSGNYNLQELRTYYTPLNYFERYTMEARYIMPTYEYVQIITEQQLLEQSVFEGWDFENVWIMTENGPQLR